MRYELKCIPFLPADAGYLAELRELSDAGWQLRAIDHLFAYLQRPIPKKSSRAFSWQEAYTECWDAYDEWGRVPISAEGDQKLLKVLGKYGYTVGSMAYSSFIEVAQRRADDERVGRIPG